MNENFKFIELTTSKGEIMVNLDQVKCIEKNAKGMAVLIFSENMMRVVQESYEDVISCLSSIKPSELS